MIKNDESNANVQVNYHVDTEKMTQTNEKTGFVRKLRPALASVNAGEASDELRFGGVSLAAAVGGASFY